MADQASSLAEKLQPASFRGVPFKVDSTEMGAGRRTQLHEYPQRDKPYVEDLGRATRDVTFTAFVVGADYVEQANKLLGALETAGPGTLVHPWFGTLTVSVKDPARVSFDAGLGVARFSMSFYESGELTFPSAAASTEAQSRLAASNLEVAAVDDFSSKFSISGVQSFVAKAANGHLTDMLGFASSGQLGAMVSYAKSAADTVSGVLSLISDPEALGWRVIDAFGLSGLVSTARDWMAISHSLVRTSASPSLSAPVQPVMTTPSNRQDYVNAAAVNALGRQALIAQAVGATSLVGTAADTNAKAGQDKILAVRDAVVGVIDREAMSASDGVYDALLTARAAVWNDLTARARDSARLTTITPAETTPALVIAYDYYGDAGRAGDIVARNDIRHPGFVPPVNLKVLTR